MSARSIPIHTSDRGKFKKCRLEWHFSSILQLGFRPVVAELPLGFGASVHTGLEVLKDPKTASFPLEVLENMSLLAFERAWRSMRCNMDGIVIAGFEEEFHEYLALGREMLKNYFGWTKRNTNKIIATEIAFEVPIIDPTTGVPLCDHQGNPVVYRGKIDCIEEDENGYWIVDYKTVGRWNDPEDLYAFLQRDDQTAGYCYAVKKVLGLKVQGVIYEQLYKGSPKKPDVLTRPYKGRQLSTNKNQDTTFELFLDAIRETGESVALYEDYLTFLREGGAKDYFRRIEVRKSDAELEYVGHQIYLEAKEMVDPNVSIYPTPSYFGCKYCSYKGPCEETMRGEDPMSQLTQTFVRTKEHYVDYGSLVID